MDKLDRFEIDDIFHAGADNEMYMKTPPHSSGAGISGYWRGMLFRSLMELQVAWTLINEEGLDIQANEVKGGKEPKVRIPVFINGLTRYYVPDFIYEKGKELIEVKAYGKYFKKDILPKIEAKVKDAGYTIRIIDKSEIRPDRNLIKRLYESGELEIHDNKLKRLHQYLSKTY
jgi:hypothetical protein